MFPQPTSAWRKATCLCTTWCSSWDSPGSLSTWPFDSSFLAKVCINKKGQFVARSSATGRQSYLQRIIFTGQINNTKCHVNWRLINPSQPPVLSHCCLTKLLYCCSKNTVPALFILCIFVSALFIFCILLLRSWTRQQKTQSVISEVNLWGKD